MLFLSCKSKNNNTLNDEAIDSVKAYLKINLNDPSSYQPVKFDTLRKTFTEPLDSLDYDLAYQDNDSKTSDMIKSMDLYDKREADGYYKKIKDSVKRS